MHNKDIIFDLDNKRVGLVDSNCSGLNISKNMIYYEDVILPMKSNYEKECENKIKTYIYSIFIVSAIAILIIILLVYGIYRLKHNKSFFCLNSNKYSKHNII
jgi:hypothetical protein